MVERSETAEAVLDKKISGKCNEAILISGGARSGTTIMGKIVHSFQNVEYVFEPPMLFSLFSLLGYLTESQWKLLYETYLYEEFLMNALAGRGINLNRSDDSSIYHAKSESAIERRLAQSLRKVDAERLAETTVIAYKMPDVVPFLPQLKRYYPGTRMILMTRKAPEVFNSLLEKGWYRDEVLRQENVIWPNRFLNGMRIPFWVDSADDEAWCGMDELNRVAYYYLRVNETLSGIPDKIQIRYDDLVSQSEAAARSLAGQLGLMFGEKTAEVLKTVERKRKENNCPALSRLKPAIREQAEHYSRLS